MVMLRRAFVLVPALLGAALAAAPVFAKGDKFQFTLGPGWVAPVTGFGNTQVRTQGPTLIIETPERAYVHGIELAYQNLPPVAKGQAAEPMPRDARHAAAWLVTHMDPSFIALIDWWSGFTLSAGASGWYEQPLITYGANDHFAVPPRISVAAALQGYPPDVVAKFKQRYPEGYPVPGKQYVTVFADFDPNSSRFVVRQIVFTFKADMKALLSDLPKPQCPPGSPGTWPNCGGGGGGGRPSLCPDGLVRDPATGRCVPPTNRGPDLRPMPSKACPPWCAYPYLVPNPGGLRANE